MKIAVLIKEVVDLVEELTVLDDGSNLEREYLAYRSNEFDDYALEEALQMKQDGDTIDVYALDGAETEQMLHMAVARGADNLFKIIINGVDLEGGISSKSAAYGFAKAIEDKGYDLILTGVQGVDDLDGSIAGHCGQIMGLPAISVIVKIEPTGDGKVTCQKEFPGGILGEYDVDLPAVIGVQASRTPPSYIPVSKVRRAAKDATINEVNVSVEVSNLSAITGVQIPISGDHAEMIEGEVEDQVAKVLEILKTRGIVS